MLPIPSPQVSPGTPRAWMGQGKASVSHGHRRVVSQRGRFRSSCSRPKPPSSSYNLPDEGQQEGFAALLNGLRAGHAGVIIAEEVSVLLLGSDAEHLLPALLVELDGAAPKTHMYFSCFCHCLLDSVATYMDRGMYTRGEESVEGFWCATIC